MALDPLSTAIATEIGKVVIKTVWDGSGKVLGMFGRTADEATQRLIFQAAQTYVKKYSDRHGILKVLGMREPVKLEEIYAAVRFLDDRALRSFESIESLETAYRQATRRSFQDKDCPRQDGLTVANETHYHHTVRLSAHVEALHHIPALVRLWGVMNANFSLD